MSFAAAAAAIERARETGAAAISAPTYEAYLQRALGTLEDLRVALVRTGFDGVTLDADVDRMGLGAAPSLARALVRLLAELTAPWLDAPIEQTLEASRDHWREQLVHYFTVLSTEEGDDASQRVWQLVTLPLLQGYYYGPVPGVIVTPPLPAKVVPGAMLGFTLSYQAIWYGANVTSTAQWVLGWGEKWTSATAEIQETIKRIAATIGEVVVEPAKRVGKGLLVAAGIGIAVGIAWLVGKK